MIKDHNPNCPQILDHPYRISIVRGSGSGEKYITYSDRNTR